MPVVSGSYQNKIIVTVLIADMGNYQGVTKRCRLSLMTNSALVYVQMRRIGERGVGRVPISTRGHMYCTLWYSLYIQYVLCVTQHSLIVSLT
jgi:hypothetical protein